MAWKSNFEKNGTDPRAEKIECYGYKVNHEQQQKKVPHSAFKYQCDCDGIVAAQYIIAVQDFIACMYVFTRDFSSISFLLHDCDKQRKKKVK